MFTGLVEEVAPVAALRPVAGGAVLSVEASLVREDARPGDSIAVNGCCLTVTALEGSRLCFDLLAETVARTNLGALRPGAPVNLERALPANGRLGGHFVQGHVDCTSRVIAMEPLAPADPALPAPAVPDHRLEIALPPEFARYVVFKGSVAVNGVSLTVAEVREASFVLWIIPHTLAATNLGALHAGDPVNMEFDLLAKYMEKLIAART